MRTNSSDASRGTSVSSQMTWLADPALGPAGAGTDPHRLHAPRRPPAHGVEHPGVVGVGQDEDDVAGDRPTPAGSPPCRPPAAR